MAVERRPRLQFTCDPEVRAAYEQWAQEEGRTVSNLLERIAVEALAKRRRKVGQPPPLPSYLPTFEQMVQNNLQRLKANLKVNDLEAIAQGNKLPTKAEFCKICSFLEVPEDIKRQLWQHLIFAIEEVGDAGSRISHS
jgi:hypothetical protein